MQILSLIFSGLAFVMATAALILVLQERKSLSLSVRNVRTKIDTGLTNQKTALMKYAEEKAAASLAEAEKLVKASDTRADEAYRRTCEYVKGVSGKLGRQCAQHNKRLVDLESGLVPDYSEALKAVNAVNDFNAGISGILGFDPMEALAKSRTEGE